MKAQCGSRCITLRLLQPRQYMWSGSQSQALAALPMELRHGNHPRVVIAGVPTEIRSRHLLTRGLDRHCFTSLTLCCLSFSTIALLMQMYLTVVTDNHEVVNHEPRMC